MVSECWVVQEHYNISIQKKLLYCCIFTAIDMFSAVKMQVLFIELSPLSSKSLKCHFGNSCTEHPSFHVRRELPWNNNVAWRQIIVPSLFGSFWIVYLISFEGGDMFTSIWSTEQLMSLLQDFKTTACDNWGNISCHVITSSCYTSSGIVSISEFVKMLKCVRCETMWGTTVRSSCFKLPS